MAMDIGAVTQQTHGEWDHWNEWSNDCANSWTPTWNAVYNEEFEQQETGAEIQYVGGKNGNSQYFQYPGYMKGVGKKGGTVTAGVAYWRGLKGDQKGYKGWGKGQKGGKGKGKTGSPSGGFQGYCHHCGEWGHSISRCKLKDEEMNKKRSGGSPADSLEGTLSLREDSSGTRSLEALEKCGGLANIVYGQQV